MEEKDLRVVEEKDLGDDGGDDKGDEDVLGRLG